MGRLLRYDPATGATTQLLTGLYFPNGVVVDADQRSLLVAESTRYRVTRYWLTGPLAGTTETFLDRLPGIADGFTVDSRGRLVLCLYDRVAALDRAVLPYPAARQLAVRATGLLLTEDNRPAGGFLVLAPDGTVLRQVTGLTPAPSNVVPFQDRWLLGALGGDRVRVVPAPR